MVSKIAELTTEFEVTGIDEVDKCIEDVRESLQRLDKALHNVKAVQKK